MPTPRPTIARAEPTRALISLAWAPWRLAGAARTTRTGRCLTIGIAGWAAIVAACIAPIGGHHPTPFDSASAYILQGAQNTALMAILLMTMGVLAWATVGVIRMALDATPVRADTPPMLIARALGLTPLALAIPVILMWGGRTVVEARWPTVDFAHLTSKPAWLEWSVFDGLASGQFLLGITLVITCLIARVWAQSDAEANAGCCHACAYPLDGLQRCPECGDRAMDPASC